MALEPFIPWERFSVKWSGSQDTLLALGGAGAASAAKLKEKLQQLTKTPGKLDSMRCEMACAATHMTYEAKSTPPASCAAAAMGEARLKHGVVATLMVLLGNRLVKRPSKRVEARRCLCERASEESGAISELESKSHAPCWAQKIR